MATFFDTWITKTADVIYRGETAPDSTKFYGILVSSDATITRASSIVDIIANELPVANGYSRQNMTFAAGSYDNTDQRHEYPNIDISWAASGASFDFQHFVILADANPTASHSFTNAEINPTTNVITITAHSFIDGDTVVFVKDTAATLPTGVAELTEYTIASSTTNTVQLSGVDFTDAGTGTFYLKSTVGELVAFNTEASTVSVLDGQTQPFTIPVVAFNGGYTTGV